VGIEEKLPSGVLLTTVEGVAGGESEGFGVRVIVDGAWGFAASHRLSTAEADRVAAEAVGIAVPVPALVVVQDPGGDRLDPERVEHAKADLGMALEDEALGLVQGAGLSQDLLRDGELAEVVELSGTLELLELATPSHEHLARASHLPVSIAQRPATR